MEEHNQGPVRADSVERGRRVPGQRSAETRGRSRMPASRPACCPCPGWRAGWPARVCLALLPIRGRL